MLPGSRGERERRQQQLDALHKAGQELADLDPGQLSEMNLKDRIDLLKQNLVAGVLDESFMVSVSVQVAYSPPGVLVVNGTRKMGSFD